MMHAVAEKFDPARCRSGGGSFDVEVDWPRPIFKIEETRRCDT
jgi:hypothetical protein